MTGPYSKRVDSTQLPSASELIDILSKESKREAIHFDFLQKNPTLFGAHRKLSQLARAEEDWIDQYQELSLSELMKKIDSNQAALVDYIQAHQTESELYETLYTSLIPKNTSIPTETIFVFGAATNARIERAVELYKQGIAPKIIISGNRPHYIPNTESEAHRMAKFATLNGVHKEDIYTEDSSITLPDNVKCTIDMLEKIDWHPSSITIIATNFVLMRGVMEWYKFCPWDISINPVAAYPQSEIFTATGWFTDEKAITLVLNEYVKLIMESKIDLMRRDKQITI